MFNFNYWENFVNQWHNSLVPAGWTNPRTNKGLSFEEIPEPWWGWHPQDLENFKKDLQSVVINFNPGPGDKHHLRQHCGYINSYAIDIVDKLGGVVKPFTPTNNWHNNRRAKRISDALIQIGAIPQPFDIKKHLSVELIPWHSVNVTKGFWDYLSNNIQVIHENVVVPAAAASTVVANAKLHNKVILRMSGGYVNRLLKELGRIGVKGKMTVNATSVGNGNFLKFTLSSCPDVEFVAIWGPNCRNNFPKSLPDILSLI